MQCFTRVSTANALATSPCASPPIPSDSTKRCSGATMRKQSSLLVRTRPTSVTPPLTICTQTPLPPRDTPDPHVASNPVPTLPDALPTRTPMNPTNYSLFGHTRRRQCLGCRRLWSTTGLRLFVYNHTMLLRPSLYACLFLCALSATPPLPLSAQRAPPASAARILLVPKRIVSGETATLADSGKIGRAH